MSTEDDFLNKQSKADQNPPSNPPIDDGTKSFDQPDGGPSKRIGHYKLLQKIADGGMGSVWMAEQTEPVKRRVALKLVKSGLDSRPIIARFEAERQALALMDHPSIAKILDGGTTESGQPYFVMELVQGLPIMQYCDKHKLSIPDRLYLFTQVCNAVQHAHQKGIIHRDLKPSNILVSIYDGKPAPKVIDFGLAKALDHKSKLTDKTLFTEFGAVVGTLQYMSPEQADLETIDIDTRADIYALGVLLYELLTGSTPIESETIKRQALLKVLATIRETDPPRPSARLSSSSHRLSEISSQRQIEPTKLQNELKGDLDWIVMRALDKDRSRRYESASGFAADIDRYLTNQPVIARPPSNAYRFSKFVRKNRRAVIAGCVMTGLLIIGLVGTTLGLLEAQHQASKANIATKDAEEAAQVASEARDDEKEQRKKAEDNLARAEKAESETKERVKELEEVTEFQQNQLSGIDVPKMALTLRADLLEIAKKRLESQGVIDEEQTKRLAELEQTFTQSKMVDASLQVLRKNIFETALKTVEEKYKDRPLFAASIYNAISSTASSLGLLDLAEKPAREALRIRRELLGDEHSNTLVSTGKMGILLDALGRSAEAEPFYRETLEKSPRILGDEHPQTLTSICNMGYLLKALGRPTEAEPFLREALEKRRRILGEEHPDTLTSIDNLAGLFKAGQRPEEAEPLVREALEKYRRILGEEHPDTLIAINNMGTVLMDLKRPTEAEPFAREALEKRRRILGEEHPNTLTSINNMGYLLNMLGRPAEAEPLVREVLEKYRRTLGEDHPNTLASINNMGAWLYVNGRPKEAEPFYREASEKCRRILGDEHPQTLHSINNLANVLLTLDRPSEAEPLSREALEGYRRLFGSDHPQTLLLVNNMGHLLTMLGRLTEAETFYREALERYRRILGNDQPQTLNSINYMGHLLTLLGRLTEAETFYREALTGFQNRNDKANIDLVRVSLAELLNKANRPNEAMELLESMMESGDISVIKNLFEAYRLLDQRERILEAAPKWLEIQRSQSLAKPLTTMNCLRVVARALNRISAFERAEPMAREAIELATKIDLKGRELARVQLTLGRTLVGLGRIEEARPLIESGHETIMREAESIRYEIRQEVIDDAQEAMNQLKEAAQKSPAD